MITAESITIGADMRLPSPAKVHSTLCVDWSIAESVPFARKKPVLEENAGTGPDWNVPNWFPVAASNI